MGLLAKLKRKIDMVRRLDSIDEQLSDVGKSQNKTLEEIQKFMKYTEEMFTALLDKLDETTNTLSAGVDEVVKDIAALRDEVASLGLHSTAETVIGDRLTAITNKLTPVAEALTAAGKDPENPLPPAEPTA